MYKLSIYHDDGSTQVVTVEDVLVHDAKGVNSTFLSGSGVISATVAKAIDQKLAMTAADLCAKHTGRIVTVTTKDGAVVTDELRGIFAKADNWVEVQMAHVTDVNHFLTNSGLRLESHSPVIIEDEK